MGMGVAIDARMREELLDRWGELARFATPVADYAGTRPLVAPTRDDAAQAIDAIRAGAPLACEDGLEAIILRFARPSYLVQDRTFRPPQDAFPESAEIFNKLEDALSHLESAIPRVGRIELTNHHFAWVGTGWMIAPRVLVTNRHVAEQFARADGDGFAFRTNALHHAIGASVDWYREYHRPHRAVFRVTTVVWMEPDGAPDVALVELHDRGHGIHEAEVLPAPLALASAAEIEVGGWIAAIGYPARDSRSRADEPRRIFDGVYDVKRLAPGRITARRPDGLLAHDATTPGTSSASVLVDLVSGKAVGIHVGGMEGAFNLAVPAPTLSEIVAKRCAR